MSLTTGIIINNGEGGPTITTITSSTTLTEHFDIIKIDGSSGSDIEIKLPDNTSIFLDRNPTKFTRIDDFVNVNNIVKITGETPANLNETGQEIVLDITIGVDVIFCSETSKYQSLDGFAEKRVQELMVRSTGSYVPGYTTAANYIAVNTTTQPHDTIDINQSGTGWVYDRTDDKFISRPYKIKWDTADTQALDTSPPNTDGVFIIFLDKTGALFVENVNNEITLKSYNSGGRNSNTELQLGSFNRLSGAITNALAGGGEKVNYGIRTDDIIDNLGVYNSVFKPAKVSFNGANLFLDINPGQGVGKAVGFLANAAGMSPDVQRAEAIVSQAPIFFITRDNVIQSFVAPGLMNVTQYEDPSSPGTLITMTSNKAKNNFYSAFLAQGLLAEIPGRREYNTVVLAELGLEAAEFPVIVRIGVPLQTVSILKDETDPPSNASINSAARLDLSIPV